MMAGPTPFAMMIVNQAIREEDLKDDEMERIRSPNRNRAVEKFAMPPEAIPKGKKQDEKSVTFPIKVNELVTIRQIPRTTQEEDRILWYSTEELDRIQEQDDADCLRAISAREGCRAFLDDSFLVNEGSIRQQVNLNCWCRYSENLRGFELVVNKRHSVERYVQKSIHNKSILLAQTIARDRMTEANMSATLARISERCSRRAREFATAMGEADECSETLQRNNTLPPQMR
jgi:hypothetical protein